MRMAPQTVLVHLEPADDLVVVHVDDRGAGIATDVASRIFEPFFTTKHGHAEAGMGLGLSVSRSLIEAMGGRIDISSDPGKGSRFTAVFPRAVAT